MWYSFGFYGAQPLHIGWEIRSKHAPSCNKEGHTHLFTQKHHRRLLLFAAAIRRPPLQASCRNRVMEAGAENLGMRDEDVTTSLQNPLACNRLLPYSASIDDEATKLFAEIRMN